MKHFAIIAITAVVITGCATQREQWAHPQLAGQPNAADRATLAQAECDAYASGRAPRPASPIFMPVPGPTSYTTTGSYQNYGSTGGTYTATTRANNSYASSFASGFNTGSAIGAAIVQAQAEERMHTISAACMRSQGWIDVSTEEGKAKMRQAAYSSSANRVDAAPTKTAQTQEQVVKRESEEWGKAVQILTSEIKGQDGAPDYTQDAEMARALGKQVEELMVARGQDPTRYLPPMQEKLDLLRQANRALMLNPQAKTWTMDYGKAYESASWRDSSTDDYKLSAGIFDTQGLFDPQVIGLVLQTKFNSPKKAGNSTFDALITFYAFDCGANTYADMGTMSFLETKVVSSNLTNRYPKFSVPTDKALINALDTYCAYAKK